MWIRDISLTTKTQDQVTVRVGNYQHRPPPRAPGKVRSCCCTKESVPRQNQRNSKPPRRYNETLSNHEASSKSLFPKSQIWASLTSKTQDQVTVRVGNYHHRPPPHAPGKLRLCRCTKESFPRPNQRTPNPPHAYNETISNHAPSSKHLFPTSQNVHSLH